MFGSTKRPYPAHVLICFWCDSNNKNFDSTKSKMAAQILCQSLELELLHGFVSCLVQRNNPTLDVCLLAFCVIRPHKFI